MSRRKGKIEISSWKVGDAENFQAFDQDEYNDLKPVTPEEDDSYQTKESTLKLKHVRQIRDS